MTSLRHACSSCASTTKPATSTWAPGSITPSGKIAEFLRDIVRPTANLRFDPTKPDGMPHKVPDVSRLHHLGWQATMPLREGLEATYRWYLNTSAVRGRAPANMIASSRT
jgi:hypothetical protein